MVNIGGIALRRRPSRRHVLGFWVSEAVNSSTLRETKPRACRCTPVSIRAQRWRRAMYNFTHSALAFTPPLLYQSLEHLQGELWLEIDLTHLCQPFGGAPRPRFQFSNRPPFSLRCAESGRRAALGEHCREDEPRASLSSVDVFRKQPACILSCKKTHPCRPVDGRSNFRDIHIYSSKTDYCRAHKQTSKKKRREANIWPPARSRS